MKNKQYIILQSSDNVATAIKDLKEGTILPVEGSELKVKILQPTPFGHKFAIRAIRSRENVIKYGEVIGKATTDILVGEHVHIQNVESLRGRGDLNQR